jgi:hypothetical protein
MQHLAEKDYEVVTYALCASVVANSKWFKNYNNELFLLAPVLDYFELLQEKVNNIGLDQQVFDNLVQQIFRRKKMSIIKLNAMSHIDNFNCKLSVIHQKYCALSTSDIYYDLTKAADIQVLTTNKVLQNKILQSKIVIDFIEPDIAPVASNSC